MIKAVFLLYLFFTLTFLTKNGIGKNASESKIPQYSVILIHNTPIDSTLLFLDSCLIAAQNKNNKFKVAEFHLKKAKHLNNSGQYNEAIVEIELCIPLFELQNNWNKIAECQYISGQSRSEIGDYSNAISFLKSATHLFDSIGDRQFYYTALTALSSAFYFVGQFDLAYSLDYEILEYAKKTKDTSLLQTSYNNIAITVISMNNNLDLAEEYFKNGIQLALMTNDYESLANFYLNLSDAYLNKKDNKNTRIALNKALFYNNYYPNESIELYIFLNSALFHHMQHNTDSGLFYIEKSLGLAQKINHINLYPDIYLLKAKLLNENGDTKNAFINALSAANWKDSLWKKDIINVSAEYEDRYKTQKRINEIQIQQSIIEKQNTKLETQTNRNLLLIIGLIVFIILLFITLLFSKKIQIANKNLKQKNRLIRENNTKLNEAIHTKDKLISIIAHDIKNPLSTVSGFAELITLSADNEDFVKLKSYGNYIRLSTQNLFNLLENLLSWAQNQNDGFKTNPENINIYKLVQNNFEVLGLMAQSKYITMTNKCSETLMAYADEQTINTVVRNLLSNAIKFTPKDGSIKVWCDESDSRVEINIKDSGIGIDENDIQKLFNKNINKALIGDRKNKGTGLGLNLCHDFMQINKGSIRVSSEIGKGSCFTINLPSQVIS